MISYQMHEAMLEIPAGWQDRSLNIFYLDGGESAGGASIVVSREPCDDSLEEHVGRMVAGAERALPRFQLVWRRRSRVGPLVSHDVRMRWSRDGAALDQRQIFVDYFGTVVAFTASTTVAQSAALQPQIDRFLAAIKFRRPQES